MNRPRAQRAPKPPPVERLIELARALAAVADGSDIFLYRTGRENLQRAMAELAHFAATANVGALADAARATLAVLELVLRRPRGGVSARLVEGNDRTVTLDVTTAELVESAARSAGVTAAEVVQRAARFYCGSILEALAETRSRAQEVESDDRA